MTKTALHILDITFAGLLFVMFYTVGEGLYDWVVIVCVAFFAYAVLKSYFNPVIFVDGRKSLVNAEILLYIFFYILFFHPYIDAVFFDLNLQHHSRFDREYTHESNRALIASTLAVLGFSAASSISLKGKRSPTNVVSPTTAALPILIFLLMSGFIVIFFAGGGSSWVFGQYQRHAQTASGLNQVYMFISWISAVAIGNALLAVQHERMNFFVKLNIVVSFLWLLVMFKIGDRNMLLLSLVVLLAFFSLYYIRIRTPILLILLAFALNAYNAIAEVRASPDKTLTLIVSEIFNPTHSSSISETNFSIQTTIVRATVHATPDQIDYFYGNFTLNALLGVVPFSRSLFLWWSDKPANSSDIARALTAGESSSFGTGTTIISDLYFDFGIAYVFVGMFFFGLLWKYIRDRAELHPFSHDRVLIYFIAVVSLAQVGRYGIAMPIRYIAWTMLLIFLAKVLSRSFASTGSFRRSLHNRDRYHKPSM